MIREWFKKTTAAWVVTAAATALAVVASAQRGSDHSGVGALAERVEHLEAKAQIVSDHQSKLMHLSDRQQIEDLYQRYMRGYDRNDIELLKSTFWPDVQINYGTGSGTVDEEVVAGVNGHMKLFAHYAHLMTNESVDIAGDVAHVESYVTEFASMRDGKSRIVLARYIDRLDRRHGEWRVAVREVIFEFFTETDNALDLNMKKNFNGAYSRSPCGMGTWDRHDPSYLRPLTARKDREFGAVCAE